ncbi:phosphate transport system regulatory protein PhoU [Flavobacterium saliperosum S13]|uniref:Phosphate-specific transport system accessory protein PhoU n=2 Tax=Flavobacterium saliperosum TaxID=329186 RepID=A0A1G4VEQ9_9FLAO|nr:phosphate signaling complex protein PhoU [Flavobacterium saliperosum]ESU25800.1 phosphate transport system regulatory protein PhoU [Flavobacterium saliperosum S13]SCX05671.1 phosphate transport system protein [Flavobacterium saliperosum]
MTQLDNEIQDLKEELIELWLLVNLQLEKVHESLISMDKDLAREVIANEKRVNSYELKLDRNCENVFALFNPVAMDLRFVLAVLKINSNLERTGDIAEGIAKFVKEIANDFDKSLLEITNINEMFETSVYMMSNVLEAFEREDTKLARKVFKQDETLDKINKKANGVIANYCRENPDNIEQALYLLSIIRKLERVGDHAKNMAEETIFYIEAKVLKHKSKSNKKK